MAWIDLAGRHGVRRAARSASTRPASPRRARLRRGGLADRERAAALAIIRDFDRGLGVVAGGPCGRKEERQARGEGGQLFLHGGALALDRGEVEADALDVVGSVHSFVFGGAFVAGGLRGGPGRSAGAHERSPRKIENKRSVPVQMSSTTYYAATFHGRRDDADKGPASISEPSLASIGDECAQAVIPTSKASPTRWTR